MSGSRRRRNESHARAARGSRGSRAADVVAAVSLLLCIGVCTIWVRSWRAFEEHTYTTELSGSGRQTYYQASWYFGTLSMSVVTRAVPAGRRDQHLADAFGGNPNSGLEYAVRRWSSQPPGYAEAMKDNSGQSRFFAGRRDATTPDGVAHSGLNVTVPCWALFLLTAAFPIGRVVRHARHRRRDQRGLCSSCGYDLRASPDRCPECRAANPG